jgi:hypothetical protein
MAMLLEMNPKVTKFTNIAKGRTKEKKKKKGGSN